MKSLQIDELTKHTYKIKQCISIAKMMSDEYCHWFREFISVNGGEIRDILA